MAMLGKRGSEVPTLVTVARAHALRGLTRAQDVTLGAAEAVLKATKSTRVQELPPPSRLPGVPSLEQATRFGFDFATEVLNAQRDFALRLSRAIRSK